MKRIFLYLYCLYMRAYSIRNNVRQLQLCDRKTIGINNAQFFKLLHEENGDISNCTNESRAC